MRIKWRHLPLIGNRRQDVPDKSGIYAIVDVPREMGLPLATVVTYVGQSKNLRRRFIEHSNPQNEPNIRIRKALYLDLSGKKKKTIEFWFLLSPLKELNRIERHLIRVIQPEANIIHFKEEKND